MSIVRVPYKRKAQLSDTMPCAMESFQEYLREKFPGDGKRSTSGVIHGSFGEHIKKALSDPSTADKNFRFYVKKERFQLLDLPNLGLSEVLVVPASDAARVSLMYRSCMCMGIN